LWKHEAQSTGDKTPERERHERIGSRITGNTARGTRTLRMHQSLEPGTWLGANASERRVEWRRHEGYCLVARSDGLPKRETLCRRKPESVTGMKKGREGYQAEQGVKRLRKPEGAAQPDWQVWCRSLPVS